MAAIRIEEMTCCAPAQLHLLPGGQDNDSISRGWHPSTGPKPGSSSSPEEAKRLAPDTPNYALRRLAVALALIALLASVSSGISTLFSSPAKAANSVEYVVKPGDTLWSIAQELGPNSDPRRTVEAIRTLNNIGPEITPGQQIILPA